MEGALSETFAGAIAIGFLLILGIAMLRATPHLVRERRLFAALAACFFGVMSLVGALVTTADMLGLIGRPAMLQ